MKTSDSLGLCIPYSIRVTPDKGRGLFADSAIRKGTIVWRHVPGQFAVYDEQSFKALLSNMPYREAVYELTHMHSMAEFPGYMIKVFDDGELMNHSEQPTLLTNTGSEYYETSPATSVQEVTTALMGGHFTFLAARDIEAGEELTYDYNTDPEDPLYYSILCEQYGVSWEWL